MSTGPQLPQPRGLEVGGVTPQERKIIQQAFSNPLEVPPIWKGWLEAWLEPLIQERIRKAIDQIPVAPPPPPPSICVAKRATDLTLTNSAWTLLNWDGELTDTDGLHDTSTHPDRITATSDGLYLVGFSFALSVISGNNPVRVGAQIQKNSEALPGTGAGVYYGVSGLGAGLGLGAGGSAIVSLVAGDYLAMVYFEDGSGTVKIVAAENPSFWLVKLS